MAEIHCFDIDIAKHYGVNSAIILQNIWHWIKKNEANETNFHGGHYWTYNSTKAFKVLFPYLSEKQIETALKKLRDNGILIVGNYNENKYDRTLWYAISEKGKSILQSGEMETTSKGNGFDSEGKPIPYINAFVNGNVNTFVNKRNNKEKNHRIENPTSGEKQISNVSSDNKNKKLNKPNYDEILKDIDNEELKELYYEYIQMRKFIKSPMTDNALKRLINRVNSLADDIEQKKQLLENAIINNWKSVYPPKDSNKANSNNQYQEPQKKKWNLKGVTRL